jgi:MFS family permease
MDMLRRGIALLTKKRDYALLMGAQFFAQAGDGIAQAALAKLIVFGGEKGFDVEGAKSPDELLQMALLVFVPYGIISPFLGVVIDRWDRRRLLFVANGLRAVVVGVVSVALIANGSVPNVVLLFTFLLTLASTRVVLSTKSAALPATLDGEHLVEGNAVSQLGGALFQLGGFGASLIATDFLDVGPVALVGAIVYGLGALLGLKIRKAGETRAAMTFGQEVARVVRNIVDGVREVARIPKAGASITTYFWLRLLWSFSLVGIGFVARELISGKNQDFQVAILTGGAGAIGAALGFISAHRMSQRVKTTAHLVLTSSAVAGLGVAILGALDTKVSLAVLTFFLGFGFFLAKISLDTMVQEALGDDFRGRAFSLYDISYNLAWIIAAGALKLVWTPDNQSLLIAGMGVVFLVGLAGIAAWFRRAGLLTPGEPKQTPAPT